MDSIFLDSDVILDVVLNRTEFSESVKLFDLIVNNDIKAYTSAFSITNIYYLSRRKFPHQKSLNIIEDILEIIELLDTNKNLIESAMHSNFSDFEDALQYHTAHKNDLKVLITRNIKDYKHSSISILTPKEYLKLNDAL